MSDSSPLPPVRLRSEAELARDALAAPLLSHAARLAHWVGPDTRVDADGELLAEQLPSAAAELGFGADADGVRYTEEAWDVALDLGLVRIVHPEESADAAEATACTVTVGAELDLLTSGSPRDVLGLWLEALETVIDEVSLPEPAGFDMADGAVRAAGGAVHADDGVGPDDGAGAEGGTGPDGGAGVGGDAEPGADVQLGGSGWSDRDLAAEADFLDGVLGNLYLLSAGEGGVDRGHLRDRSDTGGGPVPLPALAASMIVPEGMTEPTDDVLHDVSMAMLRLDEQFRTLERVGLVEFQPVDAELMADVDGTAPADGTAPGAGTAQADGIATSAGTAAAVESAATTMAPGAPDGAAAEMERYGMVRLTALGRFGLRARLVEAGFEAPVVGDLADQGAEALLHGTAEFPQAAAQDEIEQWLARRAPLAGARELLAAARGADDRAPLRRLRCQQALSLAGPAAEPALREVLGDPELGGLARVWLTEQGAPDVPPPTENMVFWLTIDTLAAQLAAEGNSAELQGLLQGLAERHSSFFDMAWRVDHPATARVLEVMGRLHPDRRIAKEARKAAFKARSQQGG